MVFFLTQRKFSFQMDTKNEEIYIFLKILSVYKRKCIVFHAGSIDKTPMSAPSHGRGGGMKVGGS